MKQQKGILWLTETLALLSGKRKLPGCECMLWPSSEQRESQRHSGPRPLLHLPLTGMKAITSGWVITGPWVTPPKRWYKSSRQPSSLREGCMQSKPGRHHAAAEMPGDVKCACRVTAVQVNAAPFVMQMRMQSACLYLWRQTDSGRHRAALHQFRGIVFVECFDGKQMFNSLCKQGLTCCKNTTVTSSGGLILEG